MKLLLFALCAAAIRAEHHLVKDIYGRPVEAPLMYTAGAPGLVYSGMYPYMNEMPVLSAPAVPKVVKPVVEKVVKPLEKVFKPVEKVQVYKAPEHVKIEKTIYKAAEPVIYKAPEPVIYKAPEHVKVEKTIYKAAEPVIYKAPETIKVQPAIYKAPEPVIYKAPETVKVEPTIYKAPEPVIYKAPETIKVQPAIYKAPEPVKVETPVVYKAPVAISQPLTYVHQPVHTQVVEKEYEVPIKKVEYVQKETPCKNIFGASVPCRKVKREAEPQMLMPYMTGYPMMHVMPYTTVAVEPKIQTVEVNKPVFKQYIERRPLEPNCRNDLGMAVPCKDYA